MVNANNPVNSDITISVERLNLLPIKDVLHASNLNVNDYENYDDEGPARDCT